MDQFYFKEHSQRKIVIMMKAKMSLFIAFCGFTGSEFSH
jgi:hypothetical protein